MGIKAAVEQAPRGGDSSGRRHSKTQDEPLKRRLNQVVGGKRPEPEFLPCCMPCNLHITKSSGKCDEKIRAGFCPEHFQGSAELLAEAVDKCSPALTVKQTHSANVTCEMTLTHEICEHRLVQKRRGEIHAPANCNKAIQKDFRELHISDSQRRE